MFISGTRYAFADPLNEGCMHLFGFSREQVYDEFLKEQVDERYGKTPHQLIQWIRTDIIRDRIGEEHWIQIMKGKIDATPPDVPILITDVSFNNEARFIQLLGGTVIQIVRPEGTTGKDVSEAGIDPDLIDSIIVNDGTKEALWQKVKDAVFEQWNDEEQKLV